MAGSESYLFSFFFLIRFSILTLQIYLAGSESKLAFFYDWIQYQNPANIFGWV
jgi:hypothetical protein